MKKRFSKLMAVLLVLVSMVSMMALPASAATVKDIRVVNAIYENATKAKVTYNTKYFTIKNGKTIKFDADISNGVLGVRKSNGTWISKSELLNQVRFDIHVYDKNGRCVNYKYGVCDGGKFKVMSNVKGIKQGEYQVKITAYISSYKTLVLEAGHHSKLAMSLKYKIKY